MRKGLQLALSILLLGMAGCSMFSPVDPTLINRYELNIPEQPVSKPKAQNISVSIALANPSYSSTEMAYTTHLHQINYFTRNRWIAPPTVMLQSVIMQALQQRYSWVLSSPLPYATTNVNLYLREFTQEFRGKTSYFHLVIFGQKFAAKKSEVEQAKLFDICIKAAPTPYGGVVAANIATREFIRQLVAFIN